MYSRIVTAFMRVNYKRIMLLPIVNNIKERFTRILWTKCRKCIRCAAKGKMCKGRSNIKRVQQNLLLSSKREKEMEEERNSEKERKKELATQQRNWKKPKNRPQSAKKKQPQKKPISNQNKKSSNGKKLKKKGEEKNTCKRKGNVKRYKSMYILRSKCCFMWVISIGVAWNETRRTMHAKYTKKFIYGLHDISDHGLRSIRFTFIKLIVWITDCLIIDTAPTLTAPTRKRGDLI